MTLACCQQRSLLGRAAPNAELHDPAVQAEHHRAATRSIPVYPGGDRGARWHAESRSPAPFWIRCAGCTICGRRAVTLFDKTDRDVPNAERYPRAPGGGHGQRAGTWDDELLDPSRFVSYRNRVEFISPALCLGAALRDLREGGVTPRWRNTALAWVLARLQLAQAEGQGIQTIRNALQTAVPGARLRSTAASVTCTLRAHRGPSRGWASPTGACPMALDGGDSNRSESSAPHGEMLADFLCRARTAAQCAGDSSGIARRVGCLAGEEKGAGEWCCQHSARIATAYANIAIGAARIRITRPRCGRRPPAAPARRCRRRRYRSHRPLRAG